MSAFENAKQFLEACDAGKGWEGCKDYAASDASFTCQADALADVSTVEDYCEWMRRLIEEPMPDASYTLHAASFDEANNAAIFAATFHATHTAEGGPVPATFNKTNTDYVYVLKMNGEGKVQKMRKIWNDAYALSELGWA